MSTNLNSTFKPEILTDPAGSTSLNGMILGVELLTSDPSDLATHYPRVWINLTSGTLKFSINGSTTKTVTAT